MQPAQDQNPAGTPSGSRPIPGPAQLPGIEGFYVVTAEGRLGRYDAGGRFVIEQSLTDSLRGQIDTLLEQYRTGGADRLAVGLVSGLGPSKPWRCASLVIGDNALRDVFRTSADPHAPLTAFQKRNKIKSVFQGMELVLDTRKTSQPEQPRFCPVLFAPEVSSRILGERYGIDYVDARNTLEVLDLMAPFSPEEQRHPSFSAMVIEMRQAQITPEMRRSPELMLVEEVGPSASPGTSSRPGQPGDDSSRTPWEDLPEQRNMGFSDGDPVPYWLLAWFAPFNELNDMQKQLLARGHRVVKRPAGTLLIEKGSEEDVSIYLIEGTLELEAYDGRRTTITGGTRRAHLPISQLRPHAYTVTAATEVSLIRFGQQMLRDVTRATSTLRNRPGIEVTEDAVSG